MMERTFLWTFLLICGTWTASVQKSTTNLLFSLQPEPAMAANLSRNLSKAKSSHSTNLVSELSLDPSDDFEQERAVNEGVDFNPDALYGANLLNSGINDTPGNIEILFEEAHRNIIDYTFGFEEKKSLNDQNLSLVVFAMDGVILVVAVIAYSLYKYRRRMI
ncbi:hypothetical protein J6590_066269 [Homalodisca vitripennis]|nr:hypothetical protein J6590_079354 [Homalodisca vitripennis]KAG8261739.1 hypothetical protein J6590_066269 [Homalodisca vitripennis]